MGINDEGNTRKLRRTPVFKNALIHLKDNYAFIYLLIDKNQFTHASCFLVPNPLFVSECIQNGLCPFIEVHKIKSNKYYALDIATKTS